MRRRVQVAEIEAKIGFSLSTPVDRLLELSKEDREFFIENLLASTSPQYLRSVKEAREDYEAGRTVLWEEAFGGKSQP